MWGIQKVAVIKLNSFMMLLCPKSASEFSFGFEHFLIINFFCTILLLPFNVVILGILLHFWGAAPLWILWPSILQGENELLQSKGRSTLSNFVIMKSFLILMVILVFVFKNLTALQCYNMSTWIFGDIWKIRSEH